MRAKKLSDLEIDIYNASLEFAERCNVLFLDSIFEVSLIGLSDNPSRSILIQDICGDYSKNSSRYRAGVQIHESGTLIFSELYNIDNQYRDYIINSLPNIKRLIREN